MKALTSNDMPISTSILLRITVVDVDMCVPEILQNKNEINKVRRA
jgi:hypothetical protein